MLVSSIQQCKSVTIIPASPPSTPPFEPCSHHRARLGSLSCAATSQQLHFTRDSACMPTQLSPFVPLSLPLCPQAHFLHLHLYAFPANRFTNNISLDSICTCINIPYLFLWLTLLRTIGSGFIHLTRTDWHSFSAAAGKYSVIYMHSCHVALFSYNLNFTVSSVKAQNLLRIKKESKTEYSCFPLLPKISGG